MDPVRQNSSKKRVENKEHLKAEMYDNINMTIPKSC